MGIATFETEIERDEYEKFLDDLRAEEEQELENDKSYQAWCDLQIEISKDLQAKIQVKEQTACEKIIEGYKDLSFRECAFIFDTRYEETKENE